MMRFRLVMGLVFIAALGLGGCGGGGAPGAATQDRNGLRIVTLSPALSQMVAALGDGGDIVGVQEHDAAAPAGLPVVGTFFDVDAEKLLSLRPSVVLMMAGKAGAPARLKQLAAAGDFKLVVYPYPNRLRDIGWILAHRGTPSWRQVPDVPGVGEVLGKAKQATALADGMFERLEALKKLTGPLKHPRVLLVIGVHPVMAAGPDTVNDQLLGFAGGRNAAEGAKFRAPTFDREALLALQPKVVILLMPGAPVLRAEDARLSDFRGLNIPAVKDHRIYLLNDPLVVLPCLSVVRTACAMAEAIHPKEAGRIKAVLGKWNVPGG